MKKSAILSTLTVLMVIFLSAAWPVWREQIGEKPPYSDQILLEEIQSLNQKIHRFKNYPDIAGHLYAKRSVLYMNLANTYTITIRQMVTFNPKELDEIKTLLIFR